MTPDEIRPGQRFSNLDGLFTGTVNRVSRGRKGRLRVFWAIWDCDPSGGEAEHLPGDERYLIALPGNRS